MKLTYAEQLKHPKWQKRRLEALQNAQFECEDCGSKEDTLHVHHKQYFKGRMAWEYDLHEYEVLCADCHQEKHRLEDRIKELMVNASADPYSLLYGWQSNNEYVEPSSIEEAWRYDPHGFMQGYIAMICGYISLESMVKVAQYAASLSLNKHARSLVENDARINEIIGLLGDET